MRTSTVILALFWAASFALVRGQNSDSDPVGPLSTNNGVSACVQFGSCTTADGSQVTETQLAPITPPASSVAIAPPTDSAESSVAISALAASGASAAYASRVANGQGAGGAADGSTSVALTGNVIAGTAPSSVARQTSTGSSDAAFMVAPPSLSNVALAPLAALCMAFGIGAFAALG